MDFILVAVLAILSLMWLYKSSIKPKNMPPGPPKLPVLGSLPFLNSCQLHMATDMVKKYGKIASFYIGKHPIVLISDYKAAKEAFQKEEWTSRPPLEPYNEAHYGPVLPELEGRIAGIVFSHGKYWREQRRFALRQLRDFGFGKATMEDSLLLEVEKLNEALAKKVGTDVCMESLLGISILNALWVLISGERLALDDPKLLALVKVANSLIKELPFTFVTPLLLPSPKLVKLPVVRDLADFPKMKRLMNNLSTFITQTVNEHNEKMTESEMDQPSEDFIEAYLKENKKVNDPESSFYGEKGQDYLVNVLMDLFVAGMETTSSSLVWTIFYLIHHPDVQEKVHKEIDKVVGRHRLPTLEDKPDMHYVNAVLLESLRLSGLAYLSVPHYTTSDTVVGGYNVPKDTIALTNLFSIMRDPDYWSKPDDFMPERFLDAEGHFHPDDHVVPFGIGKRYCLGQSLAEKEFFLFFAGMLQRFTFSASNPDSLPGYGLNDTFPIGAGRGAPRHTVRLQERV